MLAKSIMLNSLPRMSSSNRLRAYAVAAVIAHAALVLLIVGAGTESPKLALWTTSPLIVPLVIFLVARDDIIRLGGALVLGLFLFGGGALLLWGLVLNPGDANHLIALFLPIYEFIFLAIGFVILWIESVFGLLTMFVAKLFGRPPR